ncbi:MAG TPA: prepilin-type N-terminal cleavage/methylation domain-containing protein [Planctomycetota bacterium]|nr:prepilin-type N-terminal cleavage/methylation domain-containing protein [Planctomycetota bacterium]
MSAARARAGFSLTELVVAASLIGMVLAVPAMLLDASNRAYSSSSNAGAMDLDTRRALDDLTELLQRSGTEGLQTALDSMVEFKLCIGVDAGEPLWGELQRITLVPEPGEVVDGLDNDGDGLIDEHQVLWIEDFDTPGARTHVLARRVAPSLAGEAAGNGLDDNGNGLTDEAGLAITFEGERLIVRLTIMRLDAYGVRLDHTVERSIALRN